MDTTDSQKPWFYERAGQHKGSFSEKEMIEFIASGELSQGTIVWRKGLADWIALEKTELATHLDNDMPPPLTGEHVNNTIVWILAFAPLIGLMLEGAVAGIVYEGSQYSMQRALSGGEFFYITLILNVGLGFWDERSLKKAGTDTGKFKGITWLIPVYLFQRAKALKHNLAYFIVWLVSFGLMSTAFM
ncbi:MAG: DUF4339 domain-containing protein [Gammaproteobacteria bacterium]|jgi:hypothetical protein|nr:DUF4339 domain-containing protein [Gammaproteobacteria bacterium]MBQ0775215.1 DUF4339 domain-containing protein [Gammaproteobacteria bacterium]|tara:strand:- start:33331 stop:33894 length:564 start_codon:yes stop_codon:yes gene_type:complete